MYGDGCPWGWGDPSWRWSPWFKALVRYRMDVEGDELDNKAEHHQADSDMRVDPQRGSVSRTRPNGARP
jgi:hypothetical protein